MNRGVYALLLAQFLTAFADNAILFTAIAIVLQTPHTAPWYVPALQSAFLVAFVVLAPMVGPLADSRPKSQVLMLGNLLKAAGVVAMLFGLEPIAAYGLVGIGAAVYGPAKYGILPEIVDHTHLVRANSWIEGSTIVAIIAGTVVGARMADTSVHGAMIAIAICYGLSMLATLLVPRVRPTHAATFDPRHFFHMMRTLLASDRARFVMLGTSLFWAAAAVLRLLLVAWAPLVLVTHNTTDIADLTLALALGIIIGAMAAPKLIPIEHLRRARVAAYLMGLCILGLSQIESVWPARAMLVAIGVTGGLFMVPVNATLQEIGHNTIGSGGAVALQNFFENATMLLAVGAYTFAAGEGLSPIFSIVGVGIFVLVMTGLVSWHLPADTASDDIETEPKKPRTNP